MALLHYDYFCESCGNTTDDFRTFEDRHTPILCECGKPMEYVFPTEAAKGFQSFEPYYDESLGTDIHGKRERQQVMKHYGVIEAGDPVNGTRNVETSEHANRIEPMALQGIRLSDLQRKQEAGRKAREEFRIGVVERGTGRTISEPKRVTELPSAMKGKKKVRLAI